MFTGIIQSIGHIKDISINGTNRTFKIHSDLASHIKVDESISHNGICMTVEKVHKNHYAITAIEETLGKTNASDWKPGDRINLERAMKMNDRLDGHIVQGHVDGIATCTDKKNKDGSIEFTFVFDESFASLVIEKGSICVNGVSLTAFNVHKDKFTVAIIPYTLSHTNLCYVGENSIVNIEYDILGKYVNRMLKLKTM
ncbi:MAG: riboflavin synthase [Ginsengibacter sp.]